MEKYGWLTVLEDTGKRDSSGGRIVLCQCTCGKQVERPVKSLRVVHKRGGKSSCGCAPRHNRLAKGQASRTQTYHSYKNTARRRGVPFRLTKEQSYVLFEQTCHYCGAPPNNLRRAGPRAYGDYMYNGIDRVDNDLPYEVGNCVSCCRVCNGMKRQLSKQEFFVHIYRIQKHQEEKIQRTKLRGDV